MKTIIFLLLLTLSTLAFAEIGTVTRVIGTDAFIIRDSQSLPAIMNMQLEEGDRIETNNSVVLLHLFPGTQITLSENSVFSVDEHDVDLEQANETSNIVMSFLKGKLKILVEKLNSDDSTTQTIKTKTVALAVRGTQFEVEANDDETAVDVSEGKVDATSENESVTLKKNDSIQVRRDNSSHLSEKIRKGQKYINHNWRFQFLDSEKIRQHWRERRTEQRNAFFKLDPEKRKRLRELKLAKREERRIKRKEKKELRNTQRERKADRPHKRFRR